MIHIALATGVLAALPVTRQAQGGGEWNTDSTRHTVPLEEIVSGGPPKDGIPAIDRPRFVTVADAQSWLTDAEPVVVVTMNGDAKAYPHQILIWHEIVNDEVGGIPIAVTFCPLCNTALSFDRRHRGRVLDFGTTGRLRHSDLVMYDRQTETWWQQATGQGIVGALAGDRLTFITSPTVSWATFRDAYPDGRVLSRDTGHRRPYGRNPYERYDRQSGPFRHFFSGRPDGRLAAMERIAAVDVNGEHVAFPFSRLAERPVAHDEIGGERIVVFWAGQTASALDAQRIADSRRVGSTGVFYARLDGQDLTFVSTVDGRFTDEQTGSTWNILGQAVAGPLAGRTLQAIPHGNHFWFAWAAFRPDTRIAR